MRSSRALLLAGLAAWIIDALIMWLGAAPLGHDESQYAIAAKDMLEGNEPRWFYLSTGMSRIATVGNLLGGSDIAMRFPMFVLGIAFIVIAWRLAHQLFGATTAAWTVCVLAGARQTAKWSAELLSDMPATTCLLAGTLVLIVELEREYGPRWRCVIAAPLFAAAFYIRFASCIPIALLGAALLLLYARSLLRAPLLVTVVVFVALLVPHALAARQLTGSVAGILLESKSVPGHAGTAAGLITYLTSNPFLFYGLLMPPVMLAGLFAITRRDRRIAALWLAAIAVIVALGLITDAQARYVLYPTTLLVILGVDVIRVWIESRSSRWVGRIAAGLVLAAWVWTAISLTNHAPHREAGLRGTLLAAATMRVDRTPRCHVLAHHYTQLEWYSGCNSHIYSPADAPPGEHVYIVDDPDGPWRPNWNDFPGPKRRVLWIPGVIEVVRMGR